MSRALIVALLVGISSVAGAAPIAEGFTVWPGSISPDGKLGVLVPDEDHVDDAIPHQNALVEIATGRVLAVIDEDTVFAHQNHATIAPRWSADGSTLVWYVDGKWGSFAFVVISVHRGAVRWQVNVRERAVAAVLAAVRAANPKAAAAAKAHGERYGSWYRDGLTIEVRPAAEHRGKPTLPLGVVIELTSDPKQLDDFPEAARLSGTMSAVLGRTGKLAFSALRLAN